MELMHAYRQPLATSGNRASLAVMRSKSEKWLLGLGLAYVLAMPILISAIVGWKDMPVLVRALGGQTAAAWVQAIGSLLAIGAAIGIARHQANVARRDAEAREAQLRNSVRRQMVTLVRAARTAVDMRLIDEQIIPVPDWIEADELNDTRHELDIGLIAEALAKLPMTDLDEREVTALLAITALARAAQGNFQIVFDTDAELEDRLHANNSLVALNNRLDQRASAIIVIIEAKLRSERPRLQIVREAAA